MRDVLSLHIGQAGVQIGNAVWELYCYEHGISKDGELKEKSKALGIESTGIRSFFTEHRTGYFTPRAIFVDLEPTVIDEIKTSEFKNFYNSDCMLKGNEDAANNYARGYYTTGKIMMPKLMESTRKQLETSNTCQGFMIFHSFGGGTGSGFNALLLDQIMDEFPKKAVVETAIFPSPTMSTAVTEPYNTILSAHTTMKTSKCVVVVDNQAIYELCDKHGIGTFPTYKNLNNILAQAVSSITTGLRFECDLMADFYDFHTNLVPYPRLHFPIVSLAPIAGIESRGQESKTADMTFRCFEGDYSLSTTPVETGEYISCCIMYKGDVTPKDVNESIVSLKQKRSISFVSWCPTGFKFGISKSVVPMGIVNNELVTEQRSSCMLSNHTAIQHIWNSQVTKYHILFNKGAFLHWYLSEGMEPAEFKSAGDDLASLLQDYEELKQ